MKRYIYIAVMMSVLPVFASYATISPERCAAGNWQDIGYRDGVNGRSRARIASYVEACSEHGFGVDRGRYLQSYEAGLTYYCVPEKGFALGEGGSNYNAACTGEMAEGFRRAYYEGREIYNIRREYEQLVSALESRERAIFDVSYRLRNNELTEQEYRRLRNKKDRLEEERSDFRAQIRNFERVHAF